MFELFFLVEEMVGISLRLCVQAHQQPSFPAALLCLIHTEFN